MASLIFGRNIERPFFRKNDALVTLLTHLPIESTNQPSPPTKNYSSSVPSSPKSRSKPILPQLNLTQKKSDPDPFNPFESGSKSHRPSPRPSLSAIKTLYTDTFKLHGKIKTERTPPPLSCRNFNGPITKLFSPEQKTPSVMMPEKSLERSQSRKTSNGESNNVENNDDPFEHKKLMDYLDFLGKTSKSPNKEKLKEIKKEKHHTKIKNKRKSSNSHRTGESSCAHDSEIDTVPTMLSINKIISNSKIPSRTLDGSSTLVRTSTLKSTFGSQKKMTVSPGGGAITRSNTLDTSFVFGLGHRKSLRYAKQNTSLIRFYKNNHEVFFKQLAQNLNEVFSFFGNEKKVVSIIENLAEDNQKVLDLVSSKSHKFTNYDTNKLDQRFSMIELIYEALSVPVKLEKMRQGIILLEPSIMKDLHAFNDKLEGFIIQKKRDQLKQIEDRLIQTEDNLKEIYNKKIGEIGRKNKVKEYYKVKAFLNDRPRIGDYYYAPGDPVSILEVHQHDYGELKNVKLKNIEHAKGLTEVFNAWRAHINVQKE